MIKDYIFTSESVTEGHPDKMCDRISDSVLDAYFEGDKFSRVACETLVAQNYVVVAGEITSKHQIKLEEIVRNAIKEIGYTDISIGMDSKTCELTSYLHQQSGDIAMGVDRDGAGDQGIMFGFATDDTPELMPLPIALAHKLTLRLAEARKSGEVKFLRPDGKSQVTVEYKDDKPVKVSAVVISTQHSDDVSNEEIHKTIIEKIIKPVIPSNLMDDKVKYFINPTGRFVIGGPYGDSGLTGRKIIVDTYGGYGRHGGGAFSGKDPTKVDRSASYMCRYIAKNLVKAGLCKKCEVQLAYAIGVAEPVSILVDTFGTAKMPEDKIVALVREKFPLTPKGIIEKLDLRRPIYAKTASYGHFGRELPEFSWEKTDTAEKL